MIPPSSPAPRVAPALAPRAASGTEARWVLRAQTGDREALDRLLRGVQDALFRYLLGLLGEREAAEDVLQDVCFRIYRKLPWLREPALFRPWAFRIASREAFRAIRRRRSLAARFLPWPDADAPETPPAADAPPESADPELLARLPALLSQLSPASRAVLVLHYLEEMTLPEVADVLGLALGTVKSRLAYGLRALRRTLAEAAPNAGP